MNFIGYKENERVNLDRVEKYYRYTKINDEDSQYNTIKIEFRLTETSVSWHFETEKERDDVFEKVERKAQMEKLDLVTL